LSGVFKAWLSDDTTSPSRSFSGFREAGASPSAPLITSDRRQTVATDFGALAATGPSAPILMTELRTLLPQTPNPPTDDCTPSEGEFVWSNTSAKGERVADGLRAPSHCSGWTVTLNATGRVGRLVDRDASNALDWTDECALACSGTAHLYCFEQ
jgi:hypothetical protein